MSSPEVHMDPPARRRRRNFVACHRCNSQKIKCSGECPCRGCIRASVAVDCSYPDRDRKVTVSERYLKKLEAEVKASRKKDAESGGRESDGATNGVDGAFNSDAERGTVDEETLPDPTAMASPVVEQLEYLRYDQPSGSRPVYVGGAACIAFANHLRDHVKADSRSASSPQLVEVFKHPVLKRQISTSYTLPNYAYAQVLVRAMLRFIGHDYHFLRKKSFFDCMARVYASQIDGSNKFLCKLFLVFALGELYLKKSAISEARGSVPGTSFFTQAVTLHQDLFEEPDVEYIETLALMSWYSHALNRKNTAYVYAGLAMRLSITLGLHRNIMYDLAIPPVEVENRRRVFWTVYMFDRLCSSKLGHPVLIKDEDIDAPLPSVDGLTESEQEDFVDSTQLVVTIKLCRITGSILDLMYQRTSGQDPKFVANVHKLLSSLKEWDADLPNELKLNNSKSPPYASRSVASLKLHFNQAVILTTRPVLLYVFKHQLNHPSNVSDKGFPKTLPPISIAFSEACIYAARASGRLLQQLWIEGDIAIFGYFDAHYTFSLAVTLLISDLLKPNDEDKSTIDLAQSLLQTMSQEGSLPARECTERLVSLKKDLNFANTQNTTSTQGFQDAYANTAGTFAPHEPSKPEYRPDLQGVTPRGGQEYGNPFGGTVDRPFETWFGDPSIQDFLNHPDPHGPGIPWDPEIFDTGGADAGFFSLAHDTEAAFERFARDVNGS